MTNTRRGGIGWTSTRFGSRREMGRRFCTICVGPGDGVIETGVGLNLVKGVCSQGVSVHLRLASQAGQGTILGPKVLDRRGSSLFRHFKT